MPFNFPYVFFFSMSGWQNRRCRSHAAPTYRSWVMCALKTLKYRNLPWLCRNAGWFLFSSVPYNKINWQHTHIHSTPWYVHDRGKNLPEKSSTPPPHWLKLPFHLFFSSSFGTKWSSVFFFLMFECARQMQYSFQLVYLWWFKIL